MAFEPCKYNGGRECVNCAAAQDVDERQGFREGEHICVAGLADRGLDNRVSLLLGCPVELGRKAYPNPSIIRRAK